MIDLHLDDDKHIGGVVPNNPKAMNALGPEDLPELSEAYAGAGKAGVRAIPLRVDGRGFSAGRNIKGLDPRDDDATDYLANKVTPVLKQMAQFPAPHSPPSTESASAWAWVWPSPPILFMSQRMRNLAHRLPISVPR